MLTVSDVIFGSLEPATVADPQLHTHLPDMAALAWSLGVPRYLIPICEHNGNYYCIAQHGEVTLWKHENKLEGKETWDSIWQWAQHVWIEG